MHSAEDRGYVELPRMEVRRTSEKPLPRTPVNEGMKKDLAAVRAGLMEEWSTGPVEGFITKLKLLKRQGYGRANFDLLRARALAA